MLKKLSAVSVMVLMTVALLPLNAVRAAEMNFVPANRSGSEAYAGEYKSRLSPEAASEKREAERPTFFDKEWERSKADKILGTVWGLTIGLAIQAPDAFREQRERYLARNGGGDSSITRGTVPVPGKGASQGSRSQAQSTVK